MMLTNPAATLTRDEMLDTKRLIMLLRSEMHNPGSARHIAQDVDLDRETDEILYILDHALESNVAT